MLQHETYWDIVWQQFAKNRLATWAARALIPIVGIAIFAPLICSNQPLVFDDGAQRIYPWFRALFHTAETIDFLFNMTLVAFPAWAIAVVVQNHFWKKRGVSAGRRWWWFSLQLVGLTLLLVAVFYRSDLRPKNLYANREFTQEQFAAPETKQGIYALVPFGSVEQDLIDCDDRPPLFRKPKENWRESNDGFPHLLGTDKAGRDVFTRLVYGTRFAISVGLVAVSIYLTIGCVLGAVAGYFGGLADLLISRMIEIVLLFPAFFLILTLVGLLEPSIFIMMVVIGLTGWPSIARLTRGEVLKQRAADYVSAGQALGFSHARVIFRHILPNSLAPALVAAPFGIANAIITEASLSLLGFGVRPPTPSWGNILRLGFDNNALVWLILAPSFGIFFTVTVFNLIGSGLRDAMDPRLRSTN
jgi:ABC-type dipeptide/oligopeptide/nickel transport system permease subunit